MLYMKNSAGLTFGYVLSSILRYSFNRFVIQINNAGVMPITLVENLHEDEWDQIVDVNCKVSSLDKSLWISLGCIEWSWGMH